MILLFFVVLLVLLSIQFKKEPFRTKKTVFETFMNMSSLNIVDGLHKSIHPYIPYKQQYYKWKRYLRK
jgi:hypothetical protein